APTPSPILVNSSSISAVTISSDTSSPASMTALARSPTGDSAATAARNMSPVESWRMPRCSTSRAACVPLPAPGGPRRIIFIALAPLALQLRLLDQIPVLVSQKVRLDLADCVDGDVDHDEQARTAENEWKACLGNH